MCVEGTRGTTSLSTRVGRFPASQSLKLEVGPVVSYGHKTANEIKGVDSSSDNDRACELKGIL